MWCSTIGLTVILAIGILVAPLAAEAQPATKMHQIARLSPGSPLLVPHLWEVFRQGLRELGYVEGQNLVIEYRYADSQEGNCDNTSFALFS